jgi:hypothetical protein
MTTHDFLARVCEMLAGRGTGPMKLRLMIQPTVAAIFAIRAGLRDAREGRRPYFFWSAFTKSARGRELFQRAWRDVGKVFIGAVALDVIYELIVYRWVYPMQALLVATILAIVPYLLICGPVTRVLRRFMNSQRQ